MTRVRADMNNKEKDSWRAASTFYTVIVYNTANHISYVSLVFVDIESPNVWIVSALSCARGKRERTRPSRRALARRTANEDLKHCLIPARS